MDESSSLEELSGSEGVRKGDGHCSSLCPCRDTRQQRPGIGKDGQGGPISPQGLALATGGLCPVDRR